MKMAATEASRTAPSLRAGANLKAFWIALVTGWLILGTTAWLLARSRHMSAPIAVPVALSFLVEFSFYLASGFADVRRFLGQRLTRPQIALAMWATALLPYVCFALPTGYFDLPRFLVLAAIMGAAAFWFLPGKQGAWDLAFLGFLGAVILSGVLKWIFPEIQPRLPLEVLGHITLARSAFFAILMVRGAPDVVFGFIPTAREAAIGALWFLPCAAISLPLGLAMGQLKPHDGPVNVWRAAGLFFGILWVVALSEEFFFRALLQRWVTRWTRSAAAGLVSVSLLFGGCHLGMHRTFPNWNYALLATILGLSCGAAFLQTKSMRSSMVTHALAATAVKVFFS